MVLIEHNKRAPLALLALAMSAFAIGTTEFVIVGLLPDVAVDLSVSIPSAELLVSGYALGVVIGAPALTAAATRLPRKHVLLALMMARLVPAQPRAVDEALRRELAAFRHPRLWLALATTALVVGFATVPALQIRVLKQAGAANAFASAANIAAFNLGNALGAYLGGLTISAGLGYTSPSWVGATLAAAGLAVAVLAAALPKTAPAQVRTMVKNARS
ncbi:MAG: MFS transporter [Actinomycetota bacterium]|nr:MFS transporter [Actinomycetota bacterium]